MSNIYFIKNEFKLILITVIILFQFSCKNSRIQADEKPNENIRHEEMVKSDSEELQKRFNKLNSDTTNINFLEICTEMESWIGELQGLSKNIKHKKYGFKSCNTNNISFDVIFDLRANFSETELVDKFKDCEKNNYEDFNVFVFLIHMKNKIDFEETDPHGDRNIYPSLVKSFKLKDNTWVYIKQKKVTNLKEYSEFQYEVLNSGASE